MFARVMSFGVSGLQGYAVGVEVDTSGGLPQFAIVGLPETAGAWDRSKIYFS